MSTHVSVTGQRSSILIACLAPVTVFFVAFWILPVVRLIALPAQKGWQTYFLVLTDSRYMWSMINTVLLSLTTTLVTLVVGGAVGVYLARRRFAGRQVLLSLLTAPLAFPGVIIGFFIILLGGRQGWFADIGSMLGMGRITFAYGVVGLFLGYLYFSLPRAIASYTAAAEA